MKLQEMTDGLRVRTVREIDIYPINIWPIGLTGTVVRRDTDRENGLCCHVRLDEHDPSLAEWDNELQVWIEGSDEGGCTTADFEPAKEI